MGEEETDKADGKVPRIYEEDAGHHTSTNNRSG